MIDRQLDILEGIGLIEPGTRIRHAMFGEGVVEEVDRDAGAYKILFDGMETPRRISARVKLEAV